MRRQALIKEHFEHNGQQKKMQQMKDKLERLKKKQQALRQLRASQDSEIRPARQSGDERTVSASKHMDQYRRFSDIAIIMVGGPGCSSSVVVCPGGFACGVVALLP